MTIWLGQSTALGRHDAHLVHLARVVTAEPERSGRAGAHRGCITSTGVPR